MKFNKPSVEKSGPTISSITTYPTRKAKVCRLLRQKQIWGLTNDSNEVLLNSVFADLRQSLSEYLNGFDEIVNSFKIIQVQQNRTPNNMAGIY